MTLNLDVFIRLRQRRLAEIPAKNFDMDHLLWGIDQNGHYTQSTTLKDLMDGTYRTIACLAGHAILITANLEMLSKTVEEIEALARLAELVLVPVGDGKDRDVVALEGFEDIDAPMDRAGNRLMPVRVEGADQTCAV